MEKKEMERQPDKESDKSKLEGLPVDTSPYTQYKDLEDYKKQGYGTQGHQQPNPGRGAASSTDAPTLSGGRSASAHSQLSATDTINRQGVP
ncbi:PREDICTED: uncharacterized protein LOC109228239 [Nicotiana attenuata]|uniref:Uncharacterized protein n=1 Tax=Nicotiana attenuata TaxID=49451 RepID=A0A1J6J450_NICAT|nr:PREDICTED: uncharacterized protein LOC109228239 [Nicotiana attenuata]OIT02057.1 hypothetical protein A4A49_07676 [Nicotiana attenuata]